MARGAADLSNITTSPSTGARSTASPADISAIRCARSTNPTNQTARPTRCGTANQPSRATLCCSRPSAHQSIAPNCRTLTSSHFRVATRASAGLAAGEISRTACSRADTTHKLDQATGATLTSTPCP